MAEKPSHSHRIRYAGPERRFDRLSEWPHIVSRRAALAGLVVAASFGADRGNSVIAGPISDTAATENGAGPVFSATGPDAERYGAAKGFPVPGYLRTIWHGNPYEPYYRVGAFSHFDEINTTRRIKHAAKPWMFKRTQVEIPYSYRGKQSSMRNICRVIPSWAF
jgi:hypothetical protein